MEFLQDVVSIAVLANTSTANERKLSSVAESATKGSGRPASRPEERPFGACDGRVARRLAIGSWIGWDRNSITVLNPWNKAREHLLASRSFYTDQINDRYAIKSTKLIELLKSVDSVVITTDLRISTAHQAYIWE